VIDDFLKPPTVTDLTTRRDDDRQWTFYGGPMDGEKRWLPKHQDDYMMLFGMPPAGRRSVFNGKYAPASEADTLNLVMRWTQYADTGAP
jgi:hypothetical protein